MLGLSISMPHNLYCDSGIVAQLVLPRVKSFVSLVGKAEPTRSSGRRMGAASRRRESVAQCSVCRRWPPIDHMIRAPKPPDAATR